MFPTKSLLICKVFTRNLVKSSIDSVSFCKSSRTFSSSANVFTNKECRGSKTLSSSSKIQNYTFDDLNSRHINLGIVPERLHKNSPGIQRQIFELPRPCLTSLVLDLPPTRTIIPLETPVLPSIEAPGSKQEEKQAARLVVIRRRKMKKHKLRKLRIKMKFEWAKVRQRRELRKEKAFQAVLLAQIKDAEKFDAEAYVTEKLRMAKETPLPRLWKGRRLPEFLIKQYLGIK